MAYPQSGQVMYGGYVFYNMAASGTDGLKYFKSKLGFETADVAWSL